MKAKEQSMRIRDFSAHTSDSKNGRNTAQGKTILWTDDEVEWLLDIDYKYKVKDTWRVLAGSLAIVW